MNNFMTEENRTATMMEVAQQLNSPESKGEVVVLPQTAAVPSTAAVFAEPIVTAQPCQIRRDIPAFLQRMKVLAQMAGEHYRYSYPVKTKGGGKKNVEGGTIKLANDLVREYGNCMVDARVIETETHFIIYARFIDFETGFCDTRPYMQRKGQKTMGDDSERQQDIAFQIGMSKAKRNVVMNALQTYADFTYEEALNSLVNQIGKSIEQWREKMQRGISEKKYDLGRIELQVGRPIKDWLAVDMARVIAELKSIADGMATFDDLYPIAGEVSGADLNKEFLSGDAAAGTTTPAKGSAKDKPKKAEPAAADTKKDAAEGKPQATSNAEAAASSSSEQKPSDDSAKKPDTTQKSASDATTATKAVSDDKATKEAAFKEEVAKVTATTTMPVSSGDPIADRKKLANQLLDNLQAVETADERDDLMAKAGGQNLIIALNKDGQYDLVKLIKKAACLN